LFQKLDDSPLNPRGVYTVLEFNSDKRPQVRVVVKVDVDRAALDIRREVVLNPGSSRTAK